MSSSQMPIANRVFLGWSKPLVQGVAEDLISSRADLNFGNVMLVMSGGRAARRVISLLAEFAEQEKIAMVPPRIMTPGALPERLYRPKLQLAAELARERAWVTALRDCREESTTIFPKLDPVSELGAARTLERCKQELMSGCKGFGDLAKCCETVNHFGGAERARAAEKIHERYRQVLAEMNLVDAQDARAGAIESRAVKFDGEIVLAGVTEISPQLRAMLGCVADRVRVLVFAPEAMAEDFDEMGGIVTKRWGQKQIDLQNADWRTVQTQIDEASEVFISLAGQKLSADGVTICAASEETVPLIEMTAGNAGVNVRYGAGMAVDQTRPWRLLRLVEEFVEQPKFAQYLALVGNADVMDYLRERSQGEERSLWRDWLSELDRYGTLFLPEKMSAAQKEIEGWRFDGKYDNRANLVWLYRQISDLCGELLGEPRERAKYILRVLNLVYGSRSWDQNDEGQRRVVLGCYAIKSALEQLRELEARRHEGTKARSEGSSAEGIREVLALAASERVAPPMTGEEVEIIGWLELLADDAPRVVVAGMNDGVVPQCAPPDPLLNNSARGMLGLATDEDRFARDAYILTAVMESRAKNSNKSVTLISSRVTSSGDPLLPSRLMFTCNVNEMARRVEKVYPDRREEQASPKRVLKFKVAAGKQSAFPVGIEKILPAQIETITKMRVTSFRDYIASPQGFYLKHVRNFRLVEQQVPREMEARQCGDIVHATMCQFASSRAKDSISAQECVDTIVPIFRELAAKQFGEGGSVLKFQLAMVERRLEALARWQAHWAKEGWRIQSSELAAKQTLHAMEIVGKIDRIDFNANANAWAILDYKVGAKRTPADTHGKPGNWFDLQLPLYRHLAPQQGEVKLGYVCVADQLGDVGEQLADWDSAALADADAKAKEIIEKVRACDFKAVGDDPPTEGVLAHIFGEQLVKEDEE